MAVICRTSNRLSPEKLRFNPRLHLLILSSSIQSLMVLSLKIKIFSTRQIVSMVISTMVTRSDYKRPSFVPNRVKEPISSTIWIVLVNSHWTYSATNNLRIEIVWRPIRAWHNVLLLIRMARLSRVRWSRRQAKAPPFQTVWTLPQSCLIKFNTIKWRS